MNRRNFLSSSAALAASYAMPARALAPTGKWRNYDYWTRGNIVNPSMWVIMDPCSTGGLHGFIPEYFLNALEGRGIFMVGVHWLGCDGLEESFGLRYFMVGLFINFMQQQYGLSGTPNIYAQSRGALTLLSFACEAPSQVRNVTCLYPVTNPYIYPGKGPALADSHCKTVEEQDAVMADGRKVIQRYTPNDKAAGLQGKTCCIWHGTNDLTVPKNLSTDVFASKAHCVVKSLPGFGHEQPSNTTMDEMAQFMQWGEYPVGSSYV